MGRLEPRLDVRRLLRTHSALSLQVFISFAQAQSDGLEDGTDSASPEPSDEASSSGSSGGKLVGPFANAPYAYGNPQFLPEDAAVSFRPHRLDTMPDLDQKFSTRL